MITVTEAEWQEVQTQRELQQRRIEELTRQVAELHQQLTGAHQRIAELEAKKTPLPPWVKAKAPERPKRQRKKRAAEANRARRKEPPTETVNHPLERCPDCHGRVSGRHVGRTRQVIEIPVPQPIIIREHRIERGWCSFCQQWKEAAIDLRQETVGKSRVGVRLCALIAQMRSVLRLPLRQIQAWLAAHYGLRLSVGELSAITARVATAAESEYAAIRERVQKSPVVHADETGWR